MIKINLPKKDGSFDEWLDTKEDVRLKINYPVREQKHKLQNILIDAAQTKSLSSFLDHARYVLKYTIKDWDGVTDAEGQKVDCLIVGNELHDDLWYAITEDEALTTSWYNQISEKLEWNITDKKKSNSLVDSDKKE